MSKSGKLDRKEECLAVEAELKVARGWLEESKANTLRAEGQIRELEGRQKDQALEALLKALRGARDNAPAEWEALIASCAGLDLVIAWYEVKAALGEAKS